MATGYKKQQQLVYHSVCFLINTKTHARTHLDSPHIMADDKVVGGREMTMMMVKW